MKAIEDVVVPKIQWHLGKATEKWILVGADVLALISVFYLTRIYRLFIPGQTISPMFEDWNNGLNNNAETYLTLVGLTVVSFWLKGHYSKRKPYWNVVREILTTACIMGLVNATVVLFANWPVSRNALFLNWLVAPVFLLLARGIVKRLLMQAGGWVRPMVIVGWGENSVETARAFADEPLMGYRVVAFLLPEGKAKPAFEYKDSENKRIPFVPLGRDPQVALARLGFPHVVLALEQGDLEQYQDMIQRLSHHCPEIQIVPPVRGLPLYGMEVSHFFSHEVLLLTVRNNLARRGPQLIKRCFDIAASACSMLVGSPLLLWIAIRVAASGGPIFYGHKRVGKNGKTFACYKFRTMQPNADQLLKDLLERDPEAKAEWERDFKLKNDPRITPIGNFLRKTSLDELPQLWNVLKGEMSLVGPRPVVDAELERYGSQVDHYLKARPGITGLWQISGRNDITYDTRVYLDAWYVKNWSMFNDIVILLRTVKVILKRDGAY